MRWAIGDIQGCARSFEALLHAIDFNESRDELWIAGDLVNRGPDSLEVLRRLRDLGHSVRCVLGNHDLHLLAIASNIRQPGRHDTLKPLLDAADSAELLNWLRHRPLAIREDGCLMVHAGVLPQWDSQTVLSLAREVESALQGPEWVQALAQMYGNEPRAWSDLHRGSDRLRVIINALTRLRFCTAEGRMDFESKGKQPTEASKAEITSSECPEPYRPWFDWPRATESDLVIFGHWSTMGLVIRPNLLGLDSGCVWGGWLTAVSLDDRRQVQVRCEASQRPCLE